ncbi:hypothetical protein [Candidatus Amoebophilus asiaticus]|nr:hypothetical protein [Candidatus Amoebophilus asiaticus]
MLTSCTGPNLSIPAAVPVQKSAYEQQVDKTFEDEHCSPCVTVDGKYITFVQVAGEWWAEIREAASSGENLSSQQLPVVFEPGYALATLFNSTPAEQTQLIHIVVRVNGEERASYVYIAREAMSLPTQANHTSEIQVNSTGDTNLKLIATSENITPLQKFSTSTTQPISSTTSTATLPTKYYSSPFGKQPTVPVNKLKRTAESLLPVKNKSVCSQRISQHKQLAPRLQKLQTLKDEKKHKKGYTDSITAARHKVSLKEEIPILIDNALETDILTEEPSYFITADGYSIKFVRQGTKYIAIVKDKFFAGFSRASYLPVYNSLGISINKLASYNPLWHKYHIHVCPPEKDKDGKGYVYIGNSGIKGGGWTPLHDAVSWGNIE